MTVDIEKFEPSFIDDEAVRSLARMLKNITDEEGRFDLTDNIKRSKTFDEFTEAVYNALRVANTIKKQKEKAFIYIPNEEELKRIFQFAINKNNLFSLKNVIASYALSFIYRGGEDN
jgi:hypothetical protein